MAGRADIADSKFSLCVSDDEDPGGNLRRGPLPVSGGNYRPFSKDSIIKQPLVRITHLTDDLPLLFCRGALADFGREADAAGRHLPGPVRDHDASGHPPSRRPPQSRGRDRRKDGCSWRRPPGWQYHNSILTVLRGKADCGLFGADQLGQRKQSRRAAFASLIHTEHNGVILDDPAYAPT